VSHRSAPATTASAGLVPTVTPDGGGIAVLGNW
jgi:hypothetical protein